MKWDLQGHTKGTMVGLRRLWCCVVVVLAAVVLSADAFSINAPMTNVHASPWKAITAVSSRADSIRVPMETSSPSENAPPATPVAQDSAKGQDEKVDLMTYVFGKPGELDRDLAALARAYPEPFNVQKVVALGANFLGVTSYLLGLLPGSQGLDLLPAELTGFYPVRGWKRYRGEGAFEFQVPQGWLQDQAVLFANSAGPADRMQTMTMKKKAAPLVKTVAAFGPPKGDFKENVSVVKSKIHSGFSLRTLGDPAAAAQRLLDTAIAPPSSGKKATLLRAYAEPRGAGAGNEVYQFEYVVQLPSGLTLHNIGAVCARDGTLYSLTVLAPEDGWEAKKESLERVAKSFKLV